MMNKIEEPLGKANMNKVLDDFFANGENPEQGPAFLWRYQYGRHPEWSYEMEYRRMENLVQVLNSAQPNTEFGRLQDL